jgi:20S proteasome alpha/beta subunit
VYGYDAVGSFKRDEYGCMGSGQNYIMPILDNLVSAETLLYFITLQFLHLSPSNKAEMGI